MGQNPSNLSHLEKEIGSDHFPANEHYFGLVNFGNTCYCNSVLQALFFCKPFRDKVLQYKQVKLPRVVKSVVVARDVEAVNFHAAFTTSASASASILRFKY